MSASFFKGVQHAAGVPGIGLGLSMIAFGAYLKSSDFNVYQSLLSTFFAFALPGQYVMAETLLAGGNLLNIFCAVLLTNARLFPMTMYLIPILKNDKDSQLKYYFLSHLIAVTAWVNMLNIYHKINKQNRVEYFIGLGGFLWIISIICTLIGYLLSSFVEKDILLAMVFFNPLYFLIMTIRNINQRHLIITFILASIICPIIYTISNDWSVLFAGTLSGLIGYLFYKKKKNNE